MSNLQAVIQPRIPVAADMDMYADIRIGKLFLALQGAFKLSSFQKAPNAWDTSSFSFPTGQSFTA